MNDIRSGVKKIIVLEELTVHFLCWPSTHKTEWGLAVAVNFVKYSFK